ncbi:MetQ/NlpA family ABC transporter substrate-binding protein [Metallumcola ferriviriculae]|uniref:Lipoprotein n=1 Tax=Metallumcola ferriviriculae TaxID=3039180 RepID=A0AAU0UT67_9FIRM|nr:MetQ/NlpA family ABC transporter substrate-binding protein [Desulfitibacteraceae bacterium MK1]
MQIKKVLILLLVLGLTTGLAVGCGGQDNEKTPGEDQQGAAKEEVTKLLVGATPVPHAEILQEAKKLLVDKGIELEIIEFTDYVTPNKALANGDLDANYFQHVPYLDDFKEKNNLDLTHTVAVHFEPMGIYSQSIDSLDNLKDGDKVAVPNDPTNEARALLLLQDNGLITLKEGVGMEATKQDIESKKIDVEIVELEAAQIPRSLGDVGAAVINGNYAIDAGLNPATDAITAETKDSLAAQTYGNVVAIRTGEENREEIKALDEVLTSPEIKQFIEDKYRGAVVPMF